MKDTRVGVLKSVDDWISHGEEPVFWMPGLAGTGKTTIAHTIAEKYQERGLLGGSFFFSRYEQERREPRHVFTTIAFQLGNRYPRLKANIAYALRDKTVLDLAFQHHLQDLIVKPLVDLKLALFPPILIVLDALDECEGDMVSSIITALGSALEGKPTPLRFFVTSRPDRHLKAALSEDDAKGKTLVLHEVHPIEVQADLRTFFNGRLTTIAKKHADILQSGAWPTEEAVDALVVKAAGLFIYASTVLEFIGSQWGNPSERLEAILSGTSVSAVEDPYYQLDLLYTKILDGADRIRDHFPDVVGSIILLAQRLSVNGLSHLLGMKSTDVIIYLRPLHSVILVPENPTGEVHAFHLSFRDYLLDSNRCKNPNFHINPVSHHRRLALRCFWRMGRSLKKDICEIGDSGKWNSEVEEMEMKRKRHLPADLRYAILYWNKHIMEAFPDQDVLDMLENFLSEHTLHWIEALSILGRVEDGITAVKQVGRWAPVRD